MRQIRQVLAIAIAAVWILASTATPASAAPITIFNGDFEAPVYDEDGAGGDPDWHWVPDWDEGGSSYRGNGYLYLG